MNGSWHGGKGSARRQSSNQKLYEEGWERIFGKDKKKDDEKEQLEEKKEDFDRRQMWYYNSNFKLLL